MAHSGARALTRRALVTNGALIAVGLAAESRLSIALGSHDRAITLRPIPSTGERLPVVGIGTWPFAELKAASADNVSQAHEALMKLLELDGSVIDTSNDYGASEELVGKFIEQYGSRDRLFIATKTASPRDGSGYMQATLEASLRRLRADRIDLMQVHFPFVADMQLPTIFEWKRAGKVRYVGVTTSHSAKDGHSVLQEVMRRYRLDFIQVDYSIVGRQAASDILPLAQDQGVAVLINEPFGGWNWPTNAFNRVRGRNLPIWATEFGIKTWGQYFLTYVVSHPAVTCVIPGTTDVRHVADNLAVLRIGLPDDTMRRKMEMHWDSLT